MARQQGLALLARMREGPRQTSMFWRKRAEIGWAGDVARAGRLLKIAHVSEKFPIRGALSRWQLCAARRALRSVCCVGAGPLTCHSDAHSTEHCGVCGWCPAESRRCVSSPRGIFYE